MNGNHRVRRSAHDSLLGFDGTYGLEWKVNKIAGPMLANETQAKSYYVQGKSLRMRRRTQSAVYRKKAHSCTGQSLCSAVKSATQMKRGPPTLDFALVTGGLGH